MTSNYVLLVEDNPDEATLARAAFSAARVDVPLVIVEDGETALAKLRELVEPSVVILDLKLPGIDGVEVLAQIRARNQFVPVVVMTSSEEPRDIAAAYRAGANSYLAKPVDFDDFVELARDLVRYWVTRNVPATPADPT